MCKNGNDYKRPEAFKIHCVPGLVSAMPRVIYEIWSDNFIIFLHLRRNPCNENVQHPAKLKKAVGGNGSEVMTTSRVSHGEVWKENEELITLRNPKKHSLD